ncbi:MAG: hypothetical protein ACQESH_05495 [Campylobacterota bacterium]
MKEGFDDVEGLYNEGRSQLLQRIEANIQREKRKDEKVQQVLAQHQMQNDDDILDSIVNNEFSREVNYARYTQIKQYLLHNSNCFKNERYEPYIDLRPPVLFDTGKDEKMVGSMFELLEDEKNSDNKTPLLQNPQEDEGAQFLKAISHESQIELMSYIFYKHKSNFKDIDATDSGLNKDFFNYTYLFGYSASLLHEVQANAKEKQCIKKDKVIEDTFCYFVKKFHSHILKKQKDLYTFYSFPNRFNVVLYSLDGKSEKDFKQIVDTLQNIFISFFPIPLQNQKTPITDEDIKTHFTLTHKESKFSLLWIYQNITQLSDALQDVQECYEIEGKQVSLEFLNFLGFVISSFASSPMIKKNDRSTAIRKRFNTDNAALAKIYKYSFDDMMYGTSIGISPTLKISDSILDERFLISSLSTNNFKEFMQDAANLILKTLYKKRHKSNRSTVL